MSRHIHFGVGPFGLGFSGWLGSKLSLEVVLVSRSDGARRDSVDKHALLKRNRRFRIRDPEDIIQFSELIDMVDEGSEARLADLIANSETRLITFSLKEKARYSPYISAIAAGLHRRFVPDGCIDGERIAIIALENGVTSQEVNDLLATMWSPADRGVIEECVDFVPSVVDRLCGDLEIEDGDVCVSVESFARLSLEASEQFQFRNPPVTLRETIVFEPNIEVARKKKLWILNGSHLLIALNVFHHGRFLINEFLETDFDFCEGIAKEMETGALAYFEDNAELLGLRPDDLLAIAADARHFRGETLLRFRNFPDSVTRVLSRFKRETLGGFFENLSDKTAVPMGSYFAYQSYLPQDCMATMLKILNLIEQREFLRE